MKAQIRADGSPSPPGSGYGRLVSVCRVRVVPASASRRAFTLLELMNALTLAAVLATLGMYVLGRYVRHGKTLEAIGSVRAIAQAAVVYFDESDSTQPAGGPQAAAHAMRHFPASSRGWVPQSPEDVRGKRYQSARADWSPSPWRELNFSITQPQHYRYSFESSGTGKASTASAIAEGDLDGSGARSSYRQRIHVTDKYDAVLEPSLESQEE